MYHESMYLFIKDNCGFIHGNISTINTNPEFMCSFHNFKRALVLFIPSAMSTYFSTNSVHFRETLI